MEVIKSDLFTQSLKLIDEIINDSKYNSANFYFEVLNSLYRVFGEFDKKISINIFFCENMGYCHKASIKDGQYFDIKYDFKYDINDFILSDKKYEYIKLNDDKLFYQNALLTKLSIRESIFGFMVLSSNDLIFDETKDIFNTIVNIISYKIKDYELNDVFKIQLKALQDAIIEKQNAYEVIKKQHKKLQELDKTKSLFLANISHDLRTPLNAIIGFSQALDSKIFGELNSKQVEYIKDIQISSLHLLGMINEILDISKLEANAMKYSPIELNPKRVIEEVKSILAPLYESKNINVEFISNFDGLIKADYQKFQQILYNILSNAIKFTFENGKIEIIQEAINKDYILKIKDNGIGIDKKFHNKIFKKFVHLDTIQTNQASTGLGLTITKQLVKLHNGKITLESELNKGTTFTMNFRKIVL